MDRATLFTVAATRVVTIEHGTVLAEAGVIGKVELSGKTLEGVDIPRDDPETTLRAERARLLELHLGPAHTALAPKVAETYGDVEVFTYTDEVIVDRPPGGGGWFYATVVVNVAEPVTLEPATWEKHRHVQVGDR